MTRVSTVLASLRHRSIDRFTLITVG